jgi:hypothetical protein
MKVIHLLRKPCSEGTAAANVLRWGTGAMNIDGCRISTTPSERSEMLKMSQGFAGRKWGRPEMANYGYAASMPVKTVSTPSDGGRWPANLVLQHLPTCKQTETREYTACGAGCPVAGLDAQSGVSKPTGGRTVTRSGGGNVGSGKVSEKSWSNNDPGFGDTGGASRFFKQVGGKVSGEE